MLPVSLLMKFNIFFLFLLLLWIILGRKRDNLSLVPLCLDQKSFNYIGRDGILPYSLQLEVRHGRLLG